ncbi:hypothetical protein K3K61_004365 [Salmonella enterica subsp. enterica serovar Mikawasima]|nr:hypothetical protein [Salmonella enterica]EHW8722991.1 hypothetical protein [Salmonella enterica subsp. enterica serovar Mikawasima]
MKRAQLLYVFFVLPLVFLLFTPDQKIHSIYKYQDVNEHLDIHFKWPKVKITHLISDDNNNIVISEELVGFYYKNPFTNTHNIFIKSHNRTPKNEFSVASMSQQDVLTVCVYNVDKDVILFFDEVRGGIKINNKNINLSSLFLGRDGEFHCLNKK